MLCCCVYIQATLISREYSLADAFARETYVLDELGVYMLCYTLLHMEDIPVRAYIPPLGSNQSTKESGRRETGGDYVPLVFSCFSCLPQHPCLSFFLFFFLIFQLPSIAAGLPLAIKRVHILCIYSQFRFSEIEE